MAPLACFTAALTLLVLFRLVVSFAAVTAHCVDSGDFWYSTAAREWPLVGSFLLALLLLFVWNVLIGFDDWRRSAGTRVMVFVNAIAIASMLLVFPALQESAEVGYGQRSGMFDDYRYKKLFFYRSESRCVTLRRFSGRWRVVDREIGEPWLDVPGDWVELKYWGYAYARYPGERAPTAQYWYPPRQEPGDSRWQYGELFGVPWNFEIHGDLLLLTSPPDYFEHEFRPSTVVLQREPAPERTLLATPRERP